jgi:hypothetical protein
MTDAQEAHRLLQALETARADAPVEATLAQDLVGPPYVAVRIGDEVRGYRAAFAMLVAARLEALQLSLGVPMPDAAALARAVAIHACSAMLAEIDASVRQVTEAIDGEIIALGRLN